MLQSSDRLRVMIERLRKDLPPVFAATQLGARTGGAVNWPHVQNLRSKGKVPKDAFVYCGRRVLVITDLFLDWWESTLSDECQSPVPPRPSAREDQETAPVPVRPRGRKGRQRGSAEMTTAGN